MTLGTESLKHKDIRDFCKVVDSIPDFTVKGKIYAIKGSLIEVTGIAKFGSVGSGCKVYGRNGNVVSAEIVGLRDEIALLMPFGNVDGLGCGCEVQLTSLEDIFFPDTCWKGRVIDAFAQPIDGKGPLPHGDTPRPIKSLPISAYQRKRTGKRINTGVRAIDAFTTCCVGQRMGIFAGSGVGKSMLIAMCTKYTEADVKVIGLIGERGREVQEFIQDYLGEEGIANAVVIVATSDEPALVRKRAAYLTLAVSEYYRDQGMHVLCMMDNVTRFAMAQREVGLAVGEMPASKGYTPSVFLELSKLLERAGPGLDHGNSGDVTALFSVLVDGDDHNEPIADAVRGTIDGHLVLRRSIAQRRYPAIDVLDSISRTMPMCHSQAETKIITKARQLLSRYEDMADMIRLGLYRAGSDPEVDAAIKARPALESFLQQDAGYNANGEDIYSLLNACIKI
ncbi:MAG: flagellar protein export ATPase FliI [Proteobacteria bacterium]|nr:flagellar protein export ATPase FliI [Pseudomonadota bacterium]